jgi:ABC-type xylose transport system substrate-binding protein
VILGYQGVSVFKDFRLQAPAAATIAAAILNDTKPTNINATVSNGKVKVPSVMLKVVPIDPT